MPRKYRNTLKAHAHALAELGKALLTLSTSHRNAAAVVERDGASATPGKGELSDWIATSSEIAAAAERLLALQVELARTYGMSWDEVAKVLGVSRQSAWERFHSHDRWNRSRRVSQLRRQQNAAMFRRMRAGKTDDAVAILKEMLQVRSVD
ncbi:hypothetical protein NN3_05660 [Nocardia neocaledoniensis NBRC 108232]|uniref:Sigma-70-like protein n=1 Tax=Nocardia neocaledoniensis TaxID=236511 RepID=A0A317N2U6_9NOCA|nr:hypothetical protein [Nocardia neocaledoniensis]PWV68919.1 hypothetical protein DFR69_11643 [Nocardia neocaledoniensis]GEM29559.1 hypothetical protein NN3_05660 [Nocardia neocaledoniensis NBRC 108232]